MTYPARLSTSHGSVAARAPAAHSRSTIETGSSSPAIATSIAALSSLGFVPNAASTVGSETSDRAAIARRVVPTYPCSRKVPVAIRKIRRRVSRACSARPSERYVRVSRAAGIHVCHYSLWLCHSQ